MPTLTIVDLNWEKLETNIKDAKESNRHVNVTTYRKILKTPQKSNQFYFDDELAICCSKKQEHLWRQILNKLRADESDSSESEADVEVNTSFTLTDQIEFNFKKVIVLSF